MWIDLDDEYPREKTQKGKKNQKKKIKQDLEELTINEKGEITTLDGKIVSELYPVGRPQIIDKVDIGADKDAPILYYVKILADPSLHKDFSKLPLYYLQAKAKPHPKANAYLVGNDHHPFNHFHYPRCFAVQFYKIKTKSGGNKK